MLTVIFLGCNVMFGSFCSIASPFLDVVEGMLAEDVHDKDSDEGETGHEDEMNTMEEDLVHFQKCTSGELEQPTRQRG